MCQRRQARCGQRLTATQRNALKRKPGLPRKSTRKSTRSGSRAGVRMPSRLRRKRRKQKRRRHLDPRPRSLLRRSQALQVLPCLAKASNRLSTSRTVAAAATTMKKGGTRVEQALEVVAAKVIDRENLKIRRYNSYLPPAV